MPNAIHKLSWCQGPATRSIEEASALPGGHGMGPIPGIAGGLQWAAAAAAEPSP
jgi:hypothetical protein